MSKTEAQSEALHSAWEMELLAADSSLGHRMDLRRDFCRTAARNLRRLDAENKALREVLQAVEMDVVYVGSGENVLSDATRAKVEAVLGKFGAPQAVTQPVGDDREAFEAWAKSQPMILDLSPRGDGYAGAFAQTTWMGWKARGAVLAPQAAAKNGGAA